MRKTKEMIEQEEKEAVDKEKRFYEQISKAAEEWRKTEQYAKLDAEFAIEKKRMEMELRNSYISVDENLMEDYYLLVLCTKYNIDELHKILESEDVNHYVYSDNNLQVIAIFFEGIINHSDKVNIVALFKDVLNINVSLLENNKTMLDKLFDSELFGLDGLDMPSIKTNKLFIEKKTRNINTYKIIKSDKRLIKT